VAGSSLGGWLALLTACRYPERVIGVLGLAAAPDFLKTYFENYFKPEHLAILNKTGKIEFPTNDFTYIITKKMIDSGNENLLLDKEVIPYNGKVRLLQGMKDASLRWKTALTIAEKLSSDDVSVRLMKNSNHRLGSDEDIAAIKEFLSEF
jgi:pimeloyl-ACP methyl ester carboxylesterase